MLDKDMDFNSLLKLARKCEMGEKTGKLKHEIQKEHDWYQNQIMKGKRKIYGANTFPGHLDNKKVGDDNIYNLQERMIETHKIGGEPYFNDTFARLIGCVKLIQIENGGSGISPALYEHILLAVKDETFKPKIPMRASYSCGDVIPGAHWAMDVLTWNGYKYNNKLKPGEGMALINGSFVDLGSSIGLIPLIEERIVDCLINIWKGEEILNQNPGVWRIFPQEAMAGKVMKFMAENIKKSGWENEKQLSVSFRSGPQIVEMMMGVYENYISVCDKHLKSVSVNPYIYIKEEDILSQASFMIPQLSVAKSSVCEMILFNMWACQSKIERLGEMVEGIISGNSVMRVVQIPKFTKAMLERGRLLGGRKIFASGSDTSNGIEDLWTYGINTTEEIMWLINEWEKMERVLNKLLSLLTTKENEIEKEIEKINQDSLMQDSLMGDVNDDEKRSEIKKVLNF